jgi:small-conductance mechanosensitive channel
MIRILCLAVLLLGGAVPAGAQQTVPNTAGPPAPAPAVAPANAQQLLDVLRDDAKRAQLISVLEGLSKALPAAPPATAQSAPVPATTTTTTTTTTPATTSATAPPPVATAPAAVAPATPHPAAAATKLAIPLAPDSLGAQVLVGISAWLSTLSRQVADAARAVTDFPLITRWLRHLASDPDTRDEVLDAAWKLALVFCAGVGAERLVVRLLRSPVRAFSERAPALPEIAAPEALARVDASDARDPESNDAESSDAETHDAETSDAETHDAEAGEPASERHPSRLTLLLVLRRLPYALGRFAFDLVPILVMTAVASTLVGTTPLGAPSTTRLVILAMVQAYVLCRVVSLVTRLLVAPGVPRLRLLPVSDGGATYLLVWIRRIAAIGVFGYAIVEVALLFGLYRVAHDTLLKLVVLAVHICLIVIVLQKRQFFARMIRGRQDATGPVAIIRRWLARIWPFAAIFYLVAMWLVWAFEVQDGFERLFRIFLSTVAVSLVARFAVVTTHKWLGSWVSVDAKLRDRYPGLEQRLSRYHPIARAGSTTVIVALSAVVLFQAWGIDSLSWFEPGALGGRVVSGLISIGLTLIISLLIWEVANATVQRRLSEVTAAGHAGRSARLLTLLPMLRTVLLGVILLVATLLVLSEIGVNIGPLLAGAGVVGLAIGFGSQKLVQDIITGLFLLLENAMQVGDVVSLGGLSGTVENLSIRTIRLRALDGSIHIIPFSAVTTVTNSTRDYGYAVIDIGVGLSEEPERIAGVVRDIARALREEPRWASCIRDDLEVLGIDRFVDLAYIMRVRIMTLPSQRWAVGREMNERIKQKFDELAIDSPITSTKVLGTNPLITRVHRSPETGQVAG